MYVFYSSNNPNAKQRVFFFRVLCRKFTIYQNLLLNTFFLFSLFAILHGAGLSSPKLYTRLNKIQHNSIEFTENKTPILTLKTPLRHNLILVLDLDEVLLYPRAMKPENSTIRYKQYKRDYIHERPHLESFFGFAKDHFDMVIYSTAKAEYVNEMVRHFEERYKVVFNFTISREDIEYYQENLYEKPLVLLESLGDSFIIFDNQSNYYKNQKRTNKNVYLVPAWNGTPYDNELLYLMRFLQLWLNNPIDGSKFLKRCKWNIFQRLVMYFKYK